MSYNIPSVLVYQQLANAGGVANVTPDLPGVIVGPLYNVVKFDTSSAGALAKSFAGAYDERGTAAGGTNSYTLPSQYAGQVVEAADLDLIEVWMYDAMVQTFDNNGGTTVTVASVTKDSLFPVTQNPNALLADGTTALRPGDAILLSGATESLETTVVAVTDTTVQVADSISGAFSTDTEFEVYGYHSATAVQLLSSDFDTSTTSVDDTVAVDIHPSSTAGDIVKGNVHIQYRALRTDMGGRLLDIADIDDAEARLGDLTDWNPIGLGVKLGLANTTTNMRAVSVDSNDLAGYLSALEVLEGSDDVYSVVPLTQDIAIINSVVSHVKQMSVPTEGAWRIALVSTEIPTASELGSYAGASVVDDSGTFLLNVAGATFLEDGIRAGDLIELTDVASSTIDGTYVVDEVYNNTTIKFADPAPSQASANVDVVLSRTLTKSEQAAHVAATSSSFNSNRVAHIQPDMVGVQIDGATKFLPGYYMAAGLAGAIAGFPVQQGLTNISLAGFTDLDHSNFYFTRTQMNAMAEDGTMLFAQLTQDGAPYCRHELMTDMSTLQYRELLKVKNLDYLSYYFRGLLKPFIGTWNITDDTLNIMRQTIIAAAENLKGRRLPRIGAPLISYNLVDLRQDENNKDQVIIELEVATADPNNYTNLYLIV